MSEIYFTSDLHFKHDKEFMYGHRGFSSIDEHDDCIIQNWNSIIKPTDEVYLLGDIIFGNHILNSIFEDTLDVLNGKIHIILGNHDSATKVQGYKWCTNVVSIDLMNTLEIGNWNFILSHYPMILKGADQPQKKRKLYCLCGHSHTYNKFQHIDMNSYHVDLDAHDNKPVHIDTIISDILKIREMQQVENC